MLRRFAINIALVTVAACVFATCASAEFAPVAVTLKQNRHRPVAGHLFTGLWIVVNTSDEAGPYTASCGSATVHGKPVVGLHHYFSDVPQQIAVACSWRIPKSAHGELRVSGASAGTASHRVGPLTISWRIKRPRS